MAAHTATADLLRRILRAPAVRCPCCPFGTLALVLDATPVLVGCPTCGSLWAPEDWAALAASELNCAR